MATGDKWFRRLKPFIASRYPNEQGEYRMRCPLHGDTKPSATINFEKNVWNCNASCKGGTIRQLIKTLDQREAEEVEEADYDPFENVVDFEVEKVKRTGNGSLSEAEVQRWHKALLKEPEKLEAFQKRRGLTLATVKRYNIGYEFRSERYTIPVYDEAGLLMNVRKYKPDADSSQKMWNVQGYGSPPRLFPVEELAHDEILVVEGELDALIAIQNGLHAVSGTGGAKRWDSEWSKLFEGKRVSISYDNDKDGIAGAKKAARSLRSIAAEVRILPPLVQMEKGDVTDYFLGGGTAEGLRDIIKESPVVAKESAKVKPEAEREDGSELVPIQVLDSMDSTTNGKSLRMAVTITGKKNPTYSVPAEARLECTMEAGPRCKVCPMAQEWDGEHTTTIDRRDVSTIARFIDANEDKTTELLRKHVNAVKCNQFTAVVTDTHTVEELFVTASVDKRSTEGSDYTQRRVYNVGTHNTPTNTTANVVGTTWPSPKDRRNEFFSWDLHEAQTSLDNFEVSPELVNKLRVFQPAEDQSPLDKCREIATDLASNVTHIMGRERLHMAMDLVYHSVLHFPLDNKVISRGWLEFIVVGDTRTGKSETALRLSDHYGLGHVIGCEGATFAGLVGAVRQIADAWTVTWGEVTINDRRLVVLDEASGLSQDIISQLSDIRSRGVAQITKVESQQTLARTRMIWISNPRKSKFVDEKKVDGIDILEDLIGNPEDIARFDFAMSVSMDDVPTDKINRPDQKEVPHTYTAELCHDLILWAWSRKADQVEWKPDAYKAIYEHAEKLGNEYVDAPPLIQRTNVREKIARIAVAMAARTFSTDESGERIIVELDHVEDAHTFLNQLYSYENFGYRRLSDRIKHNRKIARQNTESIRAWLRENKRLLEFLIDRRGSFRAQDLEEMAYMQRDEAQEVLGRLSEAKMISKDKSQIIIEPELHKLLREMEKRMR